jgi:hypothetical protein
MLSTADLSIDEALDEARRRLSPAELQEIDNYADRLKRARELLAMRADEREAHRLVAEHDRRGAEAVRQAEIQAADAERRAEIEELAPAAAEAERIIADFDVAWRRAVAHLSGAWVLEAMKNQVRHTVGLIDRAPYPTDLGPKMERRIAIAAALEPFKRYYFTLATLDYHGLIAFRGAQQSAAALALGDERRFLFFAAGQPAITLGVWPLTAHPGL